MTRRTLMLAALAVVAALGLGALTIAPTSAAVHVKQPDCDNCPSVVHDPFLDRTCYLIPDSCENDCSYWCVYNTPIYGDSSGGD